MVSSDPKCPGSVPSSTVVPEIFPCLNCDSEIEIWTDEVGGRCSSCNTYFRKAYLSDLKILIQNAIKQGASRAKIISTAKIIIDDKLAGMCKEPRCENYGLSRSCPPHVPGPGEFRKKIANISQAIFFSIDVPYEVLHSNERHEMATGCRPSEARAFRRVDIYDGYILFAKTFGRGEELKEVKQKRVEPWPLTPEVQDILNIVPRNLTPWIFLNPDTGKPYTKNINRIWNKACLDAGVRPIDLYKSTRHSFACQHLNAGVNEKIVSRLLRQSDPNMIKRYAKYEMQPLEKAANSVTRLKSSKK